MKTVFSSHNEAAHIWASQLQNNGRAGNVFFENGQTLIVGCHQIEWDQLQLMAEQLNLTEKA